MKNNVHFNSSFGNPEKNIDKVLREPKTAMYYSKDFVDNLVEFQCKVGTSICTQAHAVTSVY